MQGRSFGGILEACSTGRNSAGGFGFSGHSVKKATGGERLRSVEKKVSKKRGENIGGACKTCHNRGCHGD